jgi:hypothetical protein
MIVRQEISISCNIDALIVESVGVKVARPVKGHAGAAGNRGRL